MQRVERRSDRSLHQSNDRRIGNYLGKSTEGVLIDEAEVVSLAADAIRYRFTGSVNVSLMARGKRDSVEFNESFPFECTTFAAASTPAAFDSDHTEIKVDTTSWTSEDE
ncbi:MULTISPECIES: pPIWI-associating nuclease domain-containing protein [unclassified Bradyrhizobium]